MAKQRRFAVFDIDGTLFRWQLFHELVQELALAGVFPQTTFQDAALAWNKWRGGELKFSEYEPIIIDTLMHYLPLVPVTTFEATCDKVIAQSGHKLYYYPKKLLHDLQEKGYVIIAISGSQQELLERFGQKYGFDIVVGALYERKGNHFTGTITRKTVGRKNDILRELVQKHGLTWEGSYSIGDSDGDIQTLELVDHPIAFNPSAELFEHAKAQDWPIVIERKNIVYRLEGEGAALVLAETIVY